MIKRTFITLTLMAMVMLLVATSVAQAQRGGGRRGFGGGFGGFGDNGPISLVGRDDVRQELDLTDKQISEIEELAEGARDSRREMFSSFQGLREASREEREQMFARMREQGAKIQSEQRAKVEKVLNSDQRKRFAQLEFQFNMQRGSVPGALAAAGIDLSDSDRQSLNETREEVNRRVEEEIAKIRRDAQNEILSTIVSKQQMEKMAGEPFEFASRERRGERGGGPGREERARRRPAEDDDDSEDGDTRSRRRRRR